MKSGSIAIAIIYLLFSSYRSPQEYRQTTDLELGNLKGKVNSTKEFTELGSLISETIYNHDGFLIRFNQWDGNDTIRWTTSYTYKDGFLVIKNLADVEKKTNYKTFYSRDSLHRVSEERQLYPDGTLYTRYRFDYDSQHRVKKKTIGSKIGQDYCYTFEYSPVETREIHCTYGIQWLYALADGLVVRKTEFLGDGGKQVFEYAYNKQRDLIKSTMFWKGEKQEWEEYSYEYDSYNNWIVKKKVSGSIVSAHNTPFTYKRVIKYF